MRTEKTRMLAGENYLANDPELVAERAQARALCGRLNAPSVDGHVPTGLLESLLPAAPGVYVTPPFQCDYGYNIRAGEGVYFNFNCVVLDVMPVDIGARTLFGPGVHIYTAMHPMSAAERRTGAESACAVRIGADVWVGGGAIVCPGVTIGDGAVIGAGSVVTRDVPDGMFAAGNPCRVIRPV